MEKTDNGGLLSIIGKVVDNTDQVWKHLVCPFKLNYTPESLGPSIQMWGKTTYEKSDGRFTNSRGQAVLYSYYQPQGIDNESSFTIVYLHSHGACRVEGYHLLRVCGIYGIGLCIFDFAGCGHSEGDFISMGIYEKDDTLVLMDILRRDYNIKNFALWGRSMGAATALLAYPKLRDTFALILDSPFTTVSHVYRNAVKQRVSLPDFVIDMVFAYASNEIVTHYGFDVSSLRPYEIGPNITIPTVLIGTREDQITDYNDLLELYNELKMPDEDKFIVECHGKHNDDRDLQSLTKIIDFLARLRKMKPLSGHPQRGAVNSLLRGPSREVSLRQNYSKSIDIRPRNDHPPQSLTTPGADALRKYTGMNTSTYQQPLSAHTKHDEISQGSPDFNQKNFHMDYTPRSQNQTANPMSEVLRESHHRNIRSNRSVNTHRIGKEWTLINPTEDKSQHYPNFANYFTPKQTVSPSQAGSPLGVQRKSRGTLKYSVGNLFPTAMPETSSNRENVSERKKNILNFLDQKDGDSNDRSFVKEQEHSKRSRPVDSHRTYHHMDQNFQQQASPTAQSNTLANQKPIQFLNIGQPPQAQPKSSYRPLIFGSKKIPQEGPFTLRNVKSSKLFNEELLATSLEMREPALQVNLIQSASVQNHIAATQNHFLAEPTYYFSPHATPYDNSQAKGYHEQVTSQPRPNFLDKKHSLASTASPLDFTFRFPEPQEVQNHAQVDTNDFQGLPFGLGRYPSPPLPPMYELQVAQEARPVVYTTPQADQYQAFSYYQQ